MTIVTFVLGLVLIAAGAGGLVASYDLLPTELGLLYACCGAILVSGGVVTVAIGVAVLRLEALTQMVHFASAVEDLPDEDDVAAAQHEHEHEHELAAHEPEAVAAELEPSAEHAEAPAVEPQPVEVHSAAVAPVEEASTEAAGRGACGRQRAERRRSRTGARRGAAADAGRPLQRRRRQLQDFLRRLDRGRNRRRRVPLRLDGRVQGLSRPGARLGA